MADDATIASLRRALVGAQRDRALVYLKVFETLTERFGEGVATDVLRAAVHARGKEIGAGMRRPDTASFLAAFAGEPAEAPLWEMAVDEHDGGATIRMGRCPLKEAWLAAGVPPARVAALCHIASALDEGTFESAGFDYTIATWTPGEAGCCRIAIRPKPGH